MLSTAYADTRAGSLGFVGSGTICKAFSYCFRAPQMYGCNVLNLGSSRIISVNPSSARQIVNDPHFKGDVQVIDFSPITSMYGAVHCSSQVCHKPRFACSPQMSGHLLIGLPRRSLYWSLA